MSSNYAIIYYYWVNVKRIKPIFNIVNPIIQSIKNTRYFTEIPIYVLDASWNKQNWENYPNLLSFKVIRITPKLNYPYLGQKVHFDLTASKPFDFFNLADEISEDIIMVLDADTFWLKSPFPLAKNPDKFCCHYNTGFLYFNKKSSLIQEFRLLWQDLIKKCINNKEFFDEIKNKTLWYKNSEIVSEELVYQFIISMNSNLIDIINCKEHIIIGENLTTEQFSQAKLIHLAGFFREKRGLFPLIVEAIYRTVKDLKFIQKLKFINKSNDYKILNNNEINGHNLIKEISKLSYDKKIYT